METETPAPVRRHTFRKRLLWFLGILILLLSIASYYFYRNFNRLLSDALMKAFNSGIISDVYELKFEKLGVNIITGNIEVYNVDLSPREKPLNNYPYINSSLQLRTSKILLNNVDIALLLKSNILKLRRVEIFEPDIDVKLAGSRYILFPFRDSADLAQKAEKNKKNFIQSYLLKEFGLINASIHILNQAKQRELMIRQFSMSLEDLLIDQYPGMNIISNRTFTLTMGDITWKFKRGPFDLVSIKDYSIMMDSLHINNNPDTTTYLFSNFTTGVKALEIQTADSLFHLTMQSFKLSYRDQSISLKGIAFKPNISDAAMQRRYKFQTPVFAGSVGALKLIGLNFDSLIYRDKVLIDAVELDKLSVTIFKDQTKPIDKIKFPSYPGQQVGSINLPILIKHIKGTNINLVNTEKKPDGDIGRVNINRMTLDAKNITTLPTNQPLSVNADAFIENKAHAFLGIRFNYDAPQFSINGRVQKFNLPDINRFLKSYTPATIQRGTADEVSFSANAYRTYSTGTMKFLYHDLKVELDLKDQAKWKSDVLSFIGNTVVSPSNPTVGDNPAKIVTFRVDRDMNKGFINIIIKSILAGFKETAIMSKENRKAYKEAKKQAKKDRKAKNS